MKVFQATLIVLLTLAGVVIFWPLLLLGIVGLVGSGWGILFLIIAPFAFIAGICEGLEKQRKAKAYSRTYIVRSLK